MFIKLRNMRGQGLVEYVLIIALIAVVCIAVLKTIGSSAKDKLTDVNEALEEEAQ